MVAAIPIEIVPQNHYDDFTWLRFFNLDKALAAVIAHIESLPSSSTPEQHTLRSYEHALRYFLQWAGNRLPTENLLTGFIGHLKSRDLRSSTISTKYLAPIRLYLRKLSSQHIPVTGSDREYVSDCKDHIRAAIDVKAPPADITNNIAPLWSQGKRLTFEQVNTTLRKIDRESIVGARDYALLLTAFESALRLAELSRLTWQSFKEEGDYWLITVRGKRNNTQPVPVSSSVIHAIDHYVTTYNAPLALDDPRRLPTRDTINSPMNDATSPPLYVMERGSGGEDRTLWQPLRNTGKHCIIGVNRYQPNKGLSGKGIRGIIARRTLAATGIELSPHDTRRTAAAMAHRKGMPINAIQGLLRHKDPAITMRYVGEEPDFKRMMLAHYGKLGI